MRLAVALALLASLAAASVALAAATPTTWCGGTAEAATDRPDEVPAFQVHVIYTFPSDEPDQFATRASAIATDIASMDVWWRAQDPTRAPRLDLAAFPGCSSTLGQLDLSVVRLPQPGATYAPDQYDLIRGALVDAGFADPDKKYLVYYDGPAVGGDHDDLVCGQSERGEPDGGRRAYSILYLGGFCSSGIGAGGVTTVTATHELIHGLDALVDPGPPHACPEDPGHPCDSPTDILYPQQTAAVTLDGLVLDVGHDDYYGHSGSWWDVQDSPFLARLDATDQTPPTAPGAFTATSGGARVTLSWQPSSDDTGVVGYRIYKNGDFVATTTATRIVDVHAATGRTYDYAVRAFDAAGFLSPKPALRFKVGAGIVDADGRIVRDTVPPPAIGRIRPRVAGRAVVLSWPAVRDPGGLRGYRVQRNGSFYALVTRPSVRIAAARARARWTIRAVDRAGNLGLPAQILGR